MKTKQPIRIGMDVEDLDDLLTGYSRVESMISEDEYIKIDDVEIEDGYAIFEGSLEKDVQNVN